VENDRNNILLNKLQKPATNSIKYASFLQHNNSTNSRIVNNAINTHKKGISSNILPPKNGGEEADEQLERFCAKHRASHAGNGLNITNYFLKTST
jgi:hypothetical protein